MKGKQFLGLSILILLIGFLIHIFAIRNGNFFFTVDQGRDAVYVREIINYHKIFFKGPETSVRGIFTGPLWYYFIAIGYFVFGGNPMGAVFALIFLNLFITALLIWWLRDKIGETKALFVGVFLQFFWPFFSSSLWGFNPFPLVGLAIIELFLLTKFLKGSNKYFIWAFIPVFLAFNTELAGATVFLILWIATGLWKIREKSSLPLAMGLGVFAGTNFQTISQKFLEMTGQTAIPQNYL